MKKKRKKVSRLRRLRVSASPRQVSLRSKVSAQSASASVAALERAGFASASVAALERAERGALLNIELPIARLRRLSNAPSAPRPKFNVILFL